MSSEGLQRIDEEECYLLAHGRSLGRIGVKLAEELVILPVYYAVLDRDIVFRTDPGTKLAAAYSATGLPSKSTTRFLHGVCCSRGTPTRSVTAASRPAHASGSATIGPPARATRSSASPSTGALRPPAPGASLRTVTADVIDFEVIGPGSSVGHSQQRPPRTGKRRGTRCAADPPQMTPLEARCVRPRARRRRRPRHPPHPSHRRHDSLAGHGTMTSGHGAC